MSYVDPDDPEERAWNEATLGPPPWRVHDADWVADDMDVAVGKFIRALPRFEVSLTLTSNLVEPNSKWTDVHLAGPGKAVEVVQSHVQAFPAPDHFWMGIYLDQARTVLALRQAVVHGSGPRQTRRVGRI